jgi:enoyl-CoA hydratase/carnithine racemase
LYEGIRRLSVVYSCEARVAQIHLEKSKSSASDLRRELNDAFRQFRRDDSAWIAIVCCDGADSWNGTLGTADPNDRESAREFFTKWAGGYHEIWKPTIAAIEGLCSGEGAALALSCDFRIGDKDSRFDFALDKLADQPHVSAAWLINLVGLSKALELLWFTDTVSAHGALELGLLNRIIEQGSPEVDNGEGRLPMHPIQRSLKVPTGDILEGAIAFADDLLLNAPITRTFQKEVAFRSIGVPFQYSQSLEIGVNPLGSADRIEGNTAFVENRRPRWSNS